VAAYRRVHFDVYRDIHDESATYYNGKRLGLIKVRVIYIVSWGYKYCVRAAVDCFAAQLQEQMLLLHAALLLLLLLYRC
jgi:hypothetical protein